MINIKEKLYGRQFSIKLDNGIYVFTTLGGTGKTYVADILEDLKLKNVLVIKYTNNNDILNSELESACSGKYDLVYMDRTDMYMNEHIFNMLISISETSTIVMDLKERPDYAYEKLDIASIYYGKEGVRIF
jgi:broad-specificity NMP kinase